MTKGNRISLAVIRSPILWGGLATLAVYAPIHAGVVQSEFVQRYFASHPVEYVATAIFLIGVASLLFKLLDIFSQSALIERPLLEPVPLGGQPAADAPRLLDTLESLSLLERGSYLVQRLQAGLEHVRRKNSADALEEELKYLSELDLERSQNSYALVRIIIWAIPMLGFLGTVIGITLAIANLSTDETALATLGAESSLQSSMPQVVAGLSVAFDTTAQALALSLILMFSMFLTERAESRLLSAVDVRVSDELAGRFEQMGTGGDPQLVAIRHMSESVIKACGQLVEKQAELWRGSINAAHQQWAQISTTTEAQIRSALSDALSENVQQFQAAFRDSTQNATALQENMNRQGHVLLQVLEATGKVTALEDTLNRNLAALSGANNFEETLHSLSAAIHLLSGRLGHVSSTGDQRVDLKKAMGEGKAA